MTTVCVAAADRRRAVSPDMFADITEAVPAFASSGEVFEVTFDLELTAADVTKVRDRLLSSDAAQEADRVTLRADRDALPADDPQRRLYDYVLGD